MASYDEQGDLGLDVRGDTVGNEASEIVAGEGGADVVGGGGAAATRRPARPRAGGWSRRGAAWEIMPHVVNERGNFAAHALAVVAIEFREGVRDRGRGRWATSKQQVIRTRWRW